MTTNVKTLLDSFDTLSEAERREAAAEILRRVAPDGDLPEESLIEVADALFVALDAEEAADARAQPR